MSAPFANTTVVDLTFTTGTNINCSIWTVKDANNDPVDLSALSMYMLYANTGFNSWSGIEPIIGPFPNDTLSLSGDSNGTIWMSNSVFNSAAGDYTYHIIGRQSSNDTVEYMRGNLHLNSSLPLVSPS